MEKYKLDRIKELKDEVKDFHPILHALFSKLPGITNVEYTQGTSEMGADFVLTKSDSTLDDVEYIGCIVKIGQIKQDHSEINRQIEECEIERTVEGGIRKIFLNEIWIISNGNITNSAQEKIHHKYRNKNIKFLPVERIASLIDKYYSQFWTDVTVQTGEYLREVRLSADNLKKNNSLVDISNIDIYVPQELVNINPRRRTIDRSFVKPKKVKLESVLESNNYVLIEAMMGTGKSTLVAELAKSYTDTKVFNEKKILPIILTSTELFEKYNSNLQNVITPIITTNGFEGIKKFIVIIDGLDEIKIDNTERLEFLNKIYQSSQNFTDIKIIVTTRTLDDPELDLNIEKQYSRYQLCPLSIKQIITMVEKICNKTDTRNKLVKELDKSPLFRVLPKTPISAILLAKLLNNNIQEIPSTMTELYNKYMELSLGRWDMEKGLQSQQEYDVISNVTILLAQFIIDNSLIDISLGDAKSIFDNYTDSRKLKINKEAIFKKLTNKVEIFAFNKPNNTLRFRHRTFAEYFYAVGLDRDNKAVISESIYDIYWATSYFFYIGLKRDCPEIINAINKIDFSSEQYRLFKIFNNGHFLLAAYLTPYEIIKESLFDSFESASKFYFDLISDESKNPLKKFSAIQLLCIFTKTLCDTFGYEFFTDALKERAYEIYTNPTITETQYIELFFLNSVRLSLGQSDSYDTMINDYGKHIPLQIQAGILEQSNDYNNSSGVVNRFVKKFQKNIKNNRGFRDAVIEIYNNSLESVLDKRITKK
jgi:hypothetical protein